MALEGGGGHIGPATGLSHTVGRLCSVFPPSRRGKCCPFFSFRVFCVWLGVFCRFFAFSSSKGRFLKKFSGANFCFWVFVLAVCFLVLFCLCFCFMFCFFSLPKVFGKILLMSGLVFLGCLLSSFGFFADVVVPFCFVCFFFFFFFQRDRSGSHRAHPPHALVFFCFFLSVSPPRLSVHPFWPCVLSFWRFVGVPFWAPGVFGILPVLF